nr:4-hydroxy-3-methylbut-2-enyl diphosphate reductase [Desulfobulbaceae bacterium]
MKVLIAKKAGFCMGVRRAVDLTLDLVNTDDQNISTFGPLIHNPQVMEVLKSKGVGVLDSVPEKATGTVIIRAHGVPPSAKESLLKSGLTVKDATCPRVLRVQAIINKHRKQGKRTIIIGDKNHAEVEGLMGYAGDDCIVVSSEAEAQALELDSPYIVVSQTTQDNQSFEVITQAIVKRFPGGQVFNTICDSTHLRQDEVRKLCLEVEALVVVGGKNSANTTRLGEIAKGLGKEVFLVESEDDLDAAALGKYDQVGITAGASTPTWMINRVVRALEAIPGRSDGKTRPAFFRVIRLLMVTNLYVSLAGSALTYACSLLQGIEPKIENSIIAFFYLFSMHNINRITDHKAKVFNDPSFIRFSGRFKKLLLISSGGFLFLSLGLTAKYGFLPFALLFCMSVFGVLYRIHFIPGFLAAKIKVSRLKEIPGSKTFFVALAWAMTVSLLPVLNASIDLSAAHLMVFAFVLVFVFVRNALFDVFDVQGDRIVGKETLPVLIGADKTLKLLNWLVGILFVYVLASSLLGVMMMPYGILALVGIVYLASFIYMFESGRLSPGVRLEFGLETTIVFFSACVVVGELW